MQAANFVETIQARQGLIISCVEEVAFRKGFISARQLRELAEEVRDGYREYLLDIANEEGTII